MYALFIFFWRVRVRVPQETTGLRMDDAITAHANVDDDLLDPALLDDLRYMLSSSCAKLLQARDFLPCCAIYYCSNVVGWFPCPSASWYVSWRGRRMRPVTLPLKVLYTPVRVVNPGSYTLPNNRSAVVLTSRRAPCFTPCASPVLN